MSQALSMRVLDTVLDTVVEVSLCVHRVGCLSFVHN
jgi:hypothetical protein